MLCDDDLFPCVGSVLPIRGILIRQKETYILRASVVEDIRSEILQALSIILSQLSAQWFFWLLVASDIALKSLSWLLLSAMMVLNMEI